jgi:hypothetical protein
MAEVTNEFLIRLLVFVLVFAFTSYAVRRFMKNRGIAILVGVAVGLMAVFYTSYSQFLLLFDVYGITGLVVALLVPFVIVFFFVYSSSFSGVLRKIIWAFYGAVNIVILQMNGSLSSETTTTITLLIGLGAVLLILFDTFIKYRFTVKRNLKIRN